MGVTVTLAVQLARPLVLQVGMEGPEGPAALLLDGYSNSHASIVIRGELTSEEDIAAVLPVKCPLSVQTHNDVFALPLPVVSWCSVQSVHLLSVNLSLCPPRILSNLSTFCLRICLSVLPLCRRERESISDGRKENGSEK
jgi:hypothetical protein